MRTESLGGSHLALPDGRGPFPGVVVVHEASGLNDNIRDICGRFAAEGYAALGQLAFRPEVDSARIGAVGFCLGGSIVLTWACTDNRLAAIAPFYGTAPKPREAIRRLCPVVGSWPGKDFTTKAAGVLETELTAAGIPHDLKVYPGAKHAFFNDQWRAYHPAAAADSWQRVLAFFAEHVRQGPP
jgi:carboxymethylenebutenolidase